jgi:hypothetical protein
MTIAAPDRPRVNETVSTRGRLQDSTIWSGLVLASALLLIAIVEWSLFHRCFTHHVAHSYPVGWDQIGVINRIYQLHFDWAKFGPAMFYSHNAWLFDKASMKGFICQLIGLVFTQMFGVSRLVAVSVNFALPLSRIMCLSAVFLICALIMQQWSCWELPLSSSGNS